MLGFRNGGSLVMERVVHWFSLIMMSSVVGKHL